MKWDKLVSEAKLRKLNRRVSSVSVADFCHLECALRAVQKAWGIKLCVALADHPRGGDNAPLVITVGPYEEVHRQELNGFEGILVEAWPVDSVPLDLQFTSAVWTFVAALEDHMQR